jgi:hypothetical protein
MLPESVELTIAVWNCRVWLVPIETESGAIAILVGSFEGADPGSVGWSPVHATIRRVVARTTTLADLKRARRRESLKV